MVGVPMVIARVVLDRSNTPGLVYGIEGALEGLVSVPWLVIGILIQANLGHGWPFVALAMMLVPRALRVGWALGAGERLQIAYLVPVALRIGTLFLAVALAISTALGFVGVGIQHPTTDLGLMLSQSRQNIEVASWAVIIPGLFLSLIGATWLVMATLFSRSGEEYRPVGWVHALS